MVISAIATAPARTRGVSSWSEIGDDGRIYVEAYASSGEPVKNAQLTITDERGNTALTGTTNQDGRFVFASFPSASITIRLTIDHGRRSEFVLAGNDLIHR